MPSNTPKMDVLALLDAYSQVHERAQKDQKASTWQLTLARKSTGRGGALMNGVMVAEDVREELRAIKVLKCTADEPELQEEETSKKLQRQFVLANATDEDKKQESVSTAAETTTTGLRRRKGNDDKENQAENEWTVEKEEELDEEDRLRRADPLVFFGAMPPKELRRAQQEAQNALARYVEAANLIVAIQQSMQQ
ncbi:expressed unknown protein [Seminavis robusta]|uniref:Vacuolar ATPase assembly protein VMA22 n=1 Tax=Seminavis robusta TaxID=568900 RepID=A0A9N8HUV7_9STRA|nr:expressed unknown protein [Seminavis robusta]|eukprot:Sro1819_g299620.1 n/a (195) ;mRNA; f:5181-5765